MITNYLKLLINQLNRNEFHRFINFFNDTGLYFLEQFKTLREERTTIFKEIFKKLLNEKEEVNMF